MKRPKGKARPARSWGIGTFVAFLCVLVVILSLLYSRSGVGDVAPTYTSLDELSDKRVGTIAGSMYAGVVEEELPKFSSENIRPYENVDDMVEALKKQEIDAFVEGKAVASVAVADHSDMALMPEGLGEEDVGIALRKNDALASKFNERLLELSLDGTLDTLRSKWLVASDEVKTMPPTQKESPNGVLRVACATIAPMAYVQDNNVMVGYEVELVQTIARDLGYTTTFYSAPFASVLSDVESGKADVGIGNITITPDRQQRFSMTIPDYSGNIVVVTHASDKQKNVDFISGVIRSFKRTFVDESRWKVILDGLGVTATISFITALVGTPLALWLVKMRYRRGKWISWHIALFQSLVGGVPIVVIIMLLYYVLFGVIDIAAEIVAIIAFVLVFSGRASGVLWDAIDAIDKGQEEGAIAMGYTPSQVYSKILFPQAIGNTRSRLVSMYVSIVKETAVVGYIAVQDLTRASDFIRARTMDAFFPLIATAIMYFVICRLLGVVLNKVGVYLLARKRKREWGEEPE